MNLLFPIASLGVINGFIVSLYLLFRKQKSIADIYFAGLVIAFCIRIGKSVLAYYSTKADPLILQIGLSACIFIGPFFFLYLKSLKEDNTKFPKADIYLLSALAIIIAGIGLVFPYSQFPAYWNPEIVQFIYAVWMIFTVLGIIKVRQILGWEFLTPWKLTGDRRYLALTVISVMLITFTYQLALFVASFTYIWGAFIFSISFYILVFRALGHKNIAAKSVSKKIEEGPEILKQLNDLMNKEKLFKDKNLKLDDLANKMNLTRHVLSQVLNETEALGFANYIKKLRVEEAKMLMLTNSHMSLEGIGYEAGFGSKSGFFETFKNIESCTPAQYKKKILPKIGPD
ncbi:transcriptional regulator, AraC family [Fulvivirga imtechensis AK7]|uniref:Transcriptional regulator, AraC family n=1 Tax=Fulvivirga imtechensis AK7 TaxID=1237149 RepID=L8JWE3_9BACT|nr:helix-turn-helix domain-containing protein [Fulvivirga imtechensis]ELR72523.1 transcriptional regulator, AraC family [Fulvivirga imtechensis AK7]